MTMKIRGGVVSMRARGSRARWRSAGAMASAGVIALVAGATLAVAAPAAAATCNVSGAPVECFQATVRVVHTFGTAVPEDETVGMAIQYRQANNVTSEPAFAPTTVIRRAPGYPAAWNSSPTVYFQASGSKILLGEYIRNGNPPIGATWADLSTADVSIACTFTDVNGSAPVPVALQSD